MGMQQTRVWKCDLCDKEETVSKGSPDCWRCDVEIRCANRKVSADFCSDCWQRAFPSSVDDINAKDTPNDEFKKPWWKKFFGVSQ